MFNIKKVKRLEKRVSELSKQLTNLLDENQSLNESKCYFALEADGLRKFIKDKCYFRNSKGQIQKCNVEKED